MALGFGLRTDYSMFLELITVRFPSFFYIQILASFKSAIRLDFPQVSSPFNNFIRGLQGYKIQGFFLMGYGRLGHH